MQENLGVWSGKNNFEQVRKTYLKYINYFPLTETDLKKPILDVGADKNYFIEYLRKTLGNKDAYGIERDERKVDLSQEGIVLGDGLTMPFKDNTFDTVIARNYLHLFFEDRKKTEQALNELVRVVKPGGRIMADVFTPATGLKYINDPEQLAGNSKEYLQRKYDGSIFFQNLLDSLKEKGYLINPKECPDENYLIIMKKPNNN